MKKTKSLAGRRRSKDEPTLNKRKSSSTAGAAHITQSNMFYLRSSPAKEVELQDWFLQSMVPFFALLVILLLSVVAYELPHGQSGSFSTSNETYWKEPASFVAHE